MNAYEKYKHLDHLLSDKEWLADNFEGAILYDLWQNIKATHEHKSNRVILEDNKNSSLDTQAG